MTKEEFTLNETLFVLTFVVPGYILIWNNFILYFLSLSISIISFRYIKAFQVLRRETKWCIYFYWISIIVLFIISCSKYYFENKLGVISIIYTFISLGIALFVNHFWVEFEDKYFIKADQ